MLGPGNRSGPLRLANAGLCRHGAHDLALPCTTLLRLSSVAA